MQPKSPRKIPVEVWFALCGLLIGFAVLFYRSGVTSPPKTASVQGRTATPRIGDPVEPAENEGPPVTLGGTFSIYTASSPHVTSPEADPLVPPTSPEVDAVLALKYYLLSDAKSEAKFLVASIPEANRDLVVRSALYAIWDRADQHPNFGDWFYGETTDPYTSMKSALETGHNPLKNTDISDAP